MIINYQKLNIFILSLFRSMTGNNDQFLFKCDKKIMKLKEDFLIFIFYLVASIFWVEEGKKIWNRSMKMRLKRFKTYLINSNNYKVTLKPYRNKYNNFKSIIWRNHGRMGIFTLDGIKTLSVPKSPITRFISILNKKYSPLVVSLLMSNFRLRMLLIKIYLHGANIGSNLCKRFLIIF